MAQRKGHPCNRHSMAPPLAPGGYEIVRAPMHTSLPALLAVKGRVQWSCSPHHALCQDEMWLEERFEDRLGPLSLLFSDQGAGKLSCLSEELKKWLSAKVQKDKSEGSASWWPAKYIGTRLYSQHRGGRGRRTVSLRPAWTKQGNLIMKPNKPMGRAEIIFHSCVGERVT